MRLHRLLASTGVPFVAPVGVLRALTRQCLFVGTDTCSCAEFSDLCDLLLASVWHPSPEAGYFSGVEVEMVRVDVRHITLRLLRVALQRSDCLLAAGPDAAVDAAEGVTRSSLARLLSSLLLQRDPARPDAASLPAAANAVLPWVHQRLLCTGALAAAGRTAALRLMPVDCTTASPPRHRAALALVLDLCLGAAQSWQSGSTRGADAAAAASRPTTQRVWQGLAAMLLTLPCLPLHLPPLHTHRVANLTLLAQLCGALAAGADAELAAPLQLAGSRDGTRPPRTAAALARVPPAAWVTGNVLELLHAALQPLRTDEQRSACVLELATCMRAAAALLERVPPELLSAQGVMWAHAGCAPALSQCWSVRVRAPLNPLLRSAVHSALALPAPLRAQLRLLASPAFVRAVVRAGLAIDITRLPAPDAWAAAEVARWALEAGESAVARAAAAAAAGMAGADRGAYLEREEERRRREHGGFACALAARAG